MEHEELGNLACQGIAVDTKYPGRIPLGFINLFAKILHTGLMIKISTLRKQIQVAQWSYWDNS